MSDLEQQNIANKPRNRRAVVKGAAWSVPVIAAAIAAPAASASFVGGASTALTTPNGNLLSIALLDGSGVLTASVGVTVPTILSITNGLGAIVGDIAGTIVVAPSGGVNLGVAGYPRSFGVASIQNAVVAPTTHNGKPGLAAPSPTTTTNFTYSGGISSNGTIDLPIAFGLTNKTSLVGLNLLSSFAVTVTLTNNGKTIIGSGTITVPVNAGVL